MEGNIQPQKKPPHAGALSARDAQRRPVGSQRAGEDQHDKLRVPLHIKEIAGSQQRDPPSPVRKDIMHGTDRGQKDEILPRGKKQKTTPPARCFSRFFAFQRTNHSTWHRVCQATRKRGERFSWENGESFFCRDLKYFRGSIRLILRGRASVRLYAALRPGTPSNTAGRAPRADSTRAPTPPRWTPGRRPHP